MDMVTLLNLIRDGGSAEYTTRIPVATRDNLAAVTSTILTYTPFMNEFASALVNKIALTMVRNRTLSNPLASLKKGGVPLGSDVEEIFTNLTSGENYDATGANLLARNIPDIKVAYYRLNRKSKYKVSISEDQLSLGFTSFADMNNLISSIVTSLYSGDNYDEFILMKNLFAECITDGKIKVISVADPNDPVSAVGIANSHALVKTIRSCSGLFQFPSSNFNTYFANKPVGDTGKAIVTWCPKESQMLVIRSDMLSNIDVDVLAQAFNMNKVDFLGRVVEVDDFGAAVDTVAVLADESAIQVYDSKQKMAEFYNGEGLYWNYIWHHWQIYGYSYFANAVAFNVPHIV